MPIGDYIVMTHAPASFDCGQVTLLLYPFDRFRVFGSLGKQIACSQV